MHSSQRGWFAHRQYGSSGKTQSPLNHTPHPMSYTCAMRLSQGAGSQRPKTETSGALGRSDITSILVILSQTVENKDPARILRRVG